jgi:enoyl-CoA hydratase
VQFVTAERLGHLLHIEFNRPEKQNRFTMEMLARFGQLLREADDNPDIRAILLTGADTDFCAGGDVADIVPAWKQGINPVAPTDINPTGLSARRLTKPLIAAVQGSCFSGGLEFALAADICIASDDARFAFEEFRYATFPFAGGVFRFARAAGKSNALRYIFTSDVFDAQQAYRMNVVAAIVPRSDLRSYAISFAKRISQCAPLAMKATLSQLDTWINNGDASALETAIVEEVKLLNSKDCAEAMQAMLQKRDAVFIGE